MEAVSNLFVLLTLLVPFPPAIPPAGAGNHAKTQAGGTAWTRPSPHGHQIPIPFHPWFKSLTFSLMSALLPHPPPLPSFLPSLFSSCLQLPGQILVPSMCDACLPVSLIAGPGNLCLPPTPLASTSCVHPFSSSLHSTLPSLPSPPPHTSISSVFFVSPDNQM